MAKNLSIFSTRGLLKLKIKNVNVSNSYFRSYSTRQKASIDGYNRFAVEYRKSWDDIKSQYNKRLPDFIEELHRLVPDDDICQRMKNIAEYQLHGGKRSKVLYSMGIWQCLKENNIIIDRELALKLSFISELFNTIHVSFDDMSENCEFRRGKPCWHRKPEVGLKAVDDYMLLYSCFRNYIMKFFKNHNAYAALQDIFVEAHHCFAIGQTMEDQYLTGVTPYDHFTFDMYKEKCVLKTATVAYLPRCQGMLLLAGLANEDNEKQISDALLEIGYLYQIQNDYFDVYYSESSTGKHGPYEDISGGKFTWFLGKAWELASKEQKNIIQDCYGKPDKNCVDQIVKVYGDLNLEKEYNKLEKEHINVVLDKINAVKGIPVEVFYHAMSVIYSWINPSMEIK